MTIDWVALFEQGGPVLGVILLISVVSLAVFLERLVYLRNGYHLPKSLLNELKHLGSDQANEVIGRLKHSNRPVSYLVLKMLEYQSHGSKETAERMRGPMTMVQKQLMRGVDMLSTVASIAPLLGLLGTVLGMMHVFQTINTHGLGNASHLAGGISEALLTTIAGLLVAIPTFVAHKVIRNRSLTIMTAIESELDNVYETLFLEKRHDQI